MPVRSTLPRENLICIGLIRELRIRGTPLAQGANALGKWVGLLGEALRDEMRMDRVLGSKSAP